MLAKYFPIACMTKWQTTVWARFYPDLWPKTLKKKSWELMILFDRHSSRLLDCNVDIMRVRPLLGGVWVKCLKAKLTVWSHIPPYTYIHTYSIIQGLMHYTEIQEQYYIFFWPQTGCSSAGNQPTSLILDMQLIKSAWDSCILRLIKGPVDALYLILSMKLSK